MKNNIFYNPNIKLYSTLSKVVKSAIDLGVNANSRARGCDYPLHNAVAFKRYKITSLLIENGADVNLRGIRGLYPLHYAVINGDIKMIKLLLKNGADVNATNDDGESALDVARNRCEENKDLVISIVLKNNHD